MIIHFLSNKIKEESEEFYDILRQLVFDLKPNKSIKFKTKKGDLGVYFKKKEHLFGILLNGYAIEEVRNAKQALDSLIRLYKSI